MAYRVRLSDHFKVHLAFHVSLLKSFHKDASNGRRQTQRAPPIVKKHYDKDIKKIVDHQILGTSKKNRMEKYLVQWKGNSEVNATWEKTTDLWQFKDQISLYLNAFPSTRMSSSFSGGGLLAA